MFNQSHCQPHDTKGYHKVDKILMTLSQIAGLNHPGNPREATARERKGTAEPQPTDHYAE